MFLLQPSASFHVKKGEKQPHVFGGHPRLHDGKQYGRPKLRGGTWVLTYALLSIRMKKGCDLTRPPNKAPNRGACIYW